MKKILLAAALVAVTGIAQAQATVSGTIRYDLSSSASTMTTGISKAEIAIGASEQLGGGLTLKGQLGFDGSKRNGSFSGTDSFVSLAGGFGSVMVGQVEAANSLLARGLGGAPVMSADGRGPVLASNTNVDIVKYTAPMVGGFTASLSSTRAIDSTGTRASTIGLSGKVGPFDSAVDYNVANSRIRASVSTQVMGLTVGVGYSGNQENVADSFVVGASKRFGNMTVGAAFTHGNGEGREIGASYALSKRTSVRLAYQNLSNGADTTQIRFQHTF